ncbi:helix-turn-helix transcriptional regulator [Microbacterium sp. PRC9]|uniref:helix-turn-helix transcriptional regulator n=1 Tax=Microbacterium sp. PRC9 TaxID=2962591 RepID=UPI0028819044|nr:helix-turn-helix transcriptional regulator [Microbacterium sp. PRC9]MDT0142366.1 helix-turn-helix transcriptional regulator [Microbacterium sp. PRC9]
MDNRSEVRDFLMSRRARVEPEDVGFARGADRRVPGLRRGEAAALAGVSVEYYARLERGQIAGASEAVLDGVARALRMDDAEREYLHRLAHQAAGTTTGARRARKPAPVWRPSPSIQWFLDSMQSAVAMVGNGRTDLLAWNPLGGALMDEMLATATSTPPNFARFIFLEPVARRFYPDWEAIAGINVAQLRTEAGRDPHSKPLHDLVGELSTRSDHFRTLWGRHDVWEHQSGVKRFHHHAVGDLTLHFNGLDLVGESGVQLTVLTAEPGSPDHDALQLLGGWASSTSRRKPPHQTDVEKTRRESGETV